MPSNSTAKQTSTIWCRYLDFEDRDMKCRERSFQIVSDDSVSAAILNYLWFWLIRIPSNTSSTHSLNLLVNPTTILHSYNKNSTNLTMNKGNSSSLRKTRNSPIKRGNDAGGNKSHIVSTHIRTSQDLYSNIYKLPLK